MPVVLKDSDLLLNDRLPYFESQGWRCLQLTDPDREFFVLLEAETLNQAGEKTLVSIGNRSERDLVFLAEYWDKGSYILVTAINLLTELKIDRKNNKKDVLISLVKYGLDQSEEWWRELQQKGIESINRKLREDIWELLRDNGYISAFSDEEKEYLFKHYANTAFDLRLSASSPPEEVATLVAERILEASYRQKQGNDLYEFYKEWSDSSTYGESLLFYADRFAKSHLEELMEHITAFERDPNHPFIAVERELYERRINELLAGESGCDAFAFAADRVKNRKRSSSDQEKGIFWDELLELEPLADEPDLTGIHSLGTFLSVYAINLWRYDALDRKLRFSRLPEPLRKWALEKVSRVNKMISNHWNTHYKPGALSDQVGLLYRILREEGKRAVIVADALRFEMACELKVRNRVKFERIPLLAVTPTETAVGMAALFSSGEIEKTEKGHRVYITDRITGRVLDNVSKREENLKELVPGVEIVELDAKDPNAEKIVIKTREIDSLGHDNMIEFFEQTMAKLTRLMDTLLKSGYTVHITSDHGFYLPVRKEMQKQDGTGTYASGTRYSLGNARPEDGKYESIDGSYIHYAREGNVFENYGGLFQHGGITHQEVVIPYLTLTPAHDEQRWDVKIANKDLLKIIQKDFTDVLLVPVTQMFGSPSRVYIQYLNERTDVNQPVGAPVSVKLKIAAKSGETFRIEVRDSENGSLLDSVKCKYLPSRERLF
jgi:hypothetical protein